MANGDRKPADDQVLNSSSFSREGENLSDKSPTYLNSAEMPRKQNQRTYRGQIVQPKESETEEQRMRR